jgi:hypothetical protein
VALPALSVLQHTYLGFALLVTVLAPLGFGSNAIDGYAVVGFIQ